MNRLVDDRVADHAQSYLQLLLFHSRPAVTGFGHELLGVDGPAFDEGAALENRADERGRVELVRMRELEIMARHRLVDGEIADHEVVVLAEERILPLLV